MQVTDSSTTMVADQSVWEAVALVGKIVHIEGRSGQFKVNSVEGPTWYACERDGQTLVDLSLTPAPWLSEPVVAVLPMGVELGEGYTMVYDLSRVVRGVNLVKGW